ncbi:unnamed protein product, partial [Musa textilis]
LPSRSFRDHHPLGLLHLTEQTMHYSTFANALARVRLFANTAPTIPSRSSNILNLLHTSASYECILLM